MKKKDFLELEYNGEFNKKVTKLKTYKYFKFQKIDEKYNYEINSKGEKILHVFFKNILNIFSNIVKIFYFNRVKGKENYNKVKDNGFFSVSNHVLYLDNILVRRALNKNNIKILTGEENSIKGIIGRILKISGCIYIPSNIKSFINMKKYLLKVTSKENKNFVHIYAEKEMWPRYEKPRPLLDGAFSFAYDCKKPILPIFFELRKIKKTNIILKVNTHILEPIYPNLRILKQDAIIQMRNETEKAIVEKYYEVFKIDSSRSLYNISNEGLKKIKEHKELTEKCVVTQM